MTKRPLGQEVHLGVQGGYTQGLDTSVGYFVKYCHKCNEGIFISREQLIELCRQAGLRVGNIPLKEKLRHIKMPQVKIEDGALILRLRSKMQDRLLDMAERVEVHQPENRLLRVKLQKHLSRVGGEAGLARVLEMRREGKTLREISDKFHCSHEWIRQIIAEYEELHGLKTVDN